MLLRGVACARKLQMSHGHAPVGNIVYRAFAVSATLCARQLKMNVLKSDPLASAQVGLHSALVSMITEEEWETKKPQWSEAIASDFKGKGGDLILYYPTEKEKIQRQLLVGLGKQQEVTLHSFRKATSAFVDKLSQVKVKDGAMLFPNVDAINTAKRDAFSNKNKKQEDESRLKKHPYPTKPYDSILDRKELLTMESVLKVIATTAFLTNYHFDKYLTKDDLIPSSLDSLTFVVNEKTTAKQMQDLKDVLNEATVLADCTNYARDLANERSEVATPEYYEQEARKLAQQFRDQMDIQVLQFDELKAKGLNMLCAVGQGAKVPPRLVLLTYRGNCESEELIALVGKGITFDSGGLNLKPTGSIEEMYLDNSGAAAVLGTLRALATLNIKHNVIGVLCLAENAISDKAYHPSAILKSYKGITVEVRNTDAEGRLVLADGLSYVQKMHGPKTIVDLATLTGACVVALGETAAGLFTNSDKLRVELENASKISGEKIWHLPIFEEHTSEIKGTESDLKNIGKGRQAGASIGAAFLKEFIEDGVAWAHLDIAGPAMYSERRGHVPKGGTGFGVQLLFEWLKVREPTDKVNEPTISS
jgi:leucyl aminopeptidase